MLGAMFDLQELRIIVGDVVARGLGHAGAPAAGLPLMLIHGLACSSEVWAPMLARTAERPCGRETIALDMPGYGRTPGPKHGLGIAELAAWNLAVLAGQGHARVHVVGHSMGCQVALAMARAEPERVASATLIGPTTGAEGQGAGRYALGLAADALFESWAYNRTLLRMWRQMGARRYVRTLPSMLRDRPISRAAEVRCPVLIVRGGRDAIVPNRVVRRLAAALPYGRRAEIPRGAHAVQFDCPDALLRELLPFLGEVEAGEQVEARRAS